MKQLTRRVLWASISQTLVLIDLLHGYLVHVRSVRNVTVRHVALVATFTVALEARDMGKGLPLVSR